MEEKWDYMKELTESELVGVYDRMCINYVDPKLMQDNIEVICEKITQHFSSHKFKIINSKIGLEGTQAIKDTQKMCSPFSYPIDDDSSVVYPSMNYPKVARFIRIILNGIRFGEESKSLFDHVLRPNNVSAILFEEFSKTFGEDSFKRIQESILELKNKSTFEITSIKNDTDNLSLPIVFVPFDDEYIQVTPLNPLYTIGNVNRIKWENLNEYFFDEKAMEISSKFMNIDPFVGSSDYTLRRIIAKFPNLMSDQNAVVLKAIKTGRLPFFNPFDREDFDGKLKKLYSLYDAYMTISKPEIVHGIHSLVSSIKYDIEEWYDNLVDIAEEEFNYTLDVPLDIQAALMQYVSNDKEGQVKISRIVDMQFI